MANGIMCQYMSFGQSVTACVLGYDVTANCPTGRNCNGIVKAYLPSISVCYYNLIRTGYVSRTCS